MTQTGREKLAQWKAQHVKHVHTMDCKGWCAAERECDGCYIVWPCPTSRQIAALEEALARLSATRPGIYDWREDANAVLDKLTAGEV